MSFCTNKNCGGEMYVCQICGRQFCAIEQSPTWIMVRRTNREGNACPSCVNNHPSALMRAIADVARPKGTESNGEEIGANFEAAFIESIRRMVAAREEIAYGRGYADGLRELGRRISP